jgi:ABC-2 type transport system permease protein
VNRTVVRLTAQAMLGGRRVLLVSAVAVVLLALGILVRLIGGISEPEIAQFIQVVSLATLMPLFGLIVGTGTIGPEIDDGSIIQLLSKPVSRTVIVQSKLVVAVAATVAFAVVPTVLAALIMGAGASLTLALGIGSLAAGAVYCVLFMLLAILTRHAVIIGLAYALIWESLVGSLVPGARNLSVQQWALSISDAIASPGLISSHVGFGLAVTFMAGGFAAATWYAGTRLRILTLATED